MIQPISTASLLVYHACLFLFFLGVYQSMDWKKHFRVPDDMKLTPISATTKAYFTTVTHISLGYGEITPKTDMARILVSVHGILSYMTILFIF